MTPAYPRPLFLMPFDHRASFVKALYGSSSTRMPAALPTTPLAIASFSPL